MNETIKSFISAVKADDKETVNRLLPELEQVLSGDMVIVGVWSVDDIRRHPDGEDLNDDQCRAVLASLQEAGAEIDDDVMTGIILSVKNGLSTGPA